MKKTLIRKRDKIRNKISKNIGGLMNEMGRNLPLNCLNALKQNNKLNKSMTITSY